MQLQVEAVCGVMEAVSLEAFSGDKDGNFDAIEWVNSALAARCVTARCCRCCRSCQTRSHFRRGLFSLFASTL